MTALLDANVLIALGVADHVHHDVVEEWFTALEEPFASCPMTQGALVRLVLREGASAAEAVAVLAGVTSHPGHDFWPDDLGYEQVTMAGVVGHRQVTDAYLAALTRHRGGRLATLDRGLALLHHDVALLIHVDGPEGPTGTRDSTAVPGPRTQTWSRRGPSGGIAAQTSQQRRSVDDEESASAEGRIDPMELLLQSKLRRKGPRRFPHLVATALRLAWQASPAASPPPLACNCSARSP